MDHTLGASLLIVKRETEGRSESVVTVIREVFEHGDSHALAEEIAKSFIGAPVKIEVYRRVATYEAAVTVTMKKDGE